MNEQCPKCGSYLTRWIGRSRYYIRKGKTTKDVVGCDSCFHTWRYSSQGNAITVKDWVGKELGG